MKEFRRLSDVLLPREGPILEFATEDTAEHSRGEQPDKRSQIALNSVTRAAGRPAVVVRFQFEVRLRVNLAQLGKERASPLPRDRTRPPEILLLVSAKSKKTLASESVRLDIPPFYPRTSILFLSQCLQCLNGLLHLALLQEGIIQTLTEVESGRRHACDLDREWSSEVETVVNQRSPQAKRHGYAMLERANSLCSKISCEEKPSSDRRQTRNIFGSQACSANTWFKHLFINMRDLIQDT